MALAQLRIRLEMGNFHNAIYSFQGPAWMLAANVEWMDLFLRSLFGGPVAQVTSYNGLLCRTSAVYVGEALLKIWVAKRFRA